jgi:putative peptidoglycan lipid II flippase
VIVTSVLLVIDRNLASQTGTGSISAMRFATTLIQFALGLVVAGISLASLPSLSQHFARGDTESFKRTLASGLRMVMVLVLPAAAGLLALGTPLVEIFFRHGEFTAEDQQRTVLALLFYVPGLPFSAIDQVLLMAFYARKNTLTPALIGIAQMPIYLAVALTTLQPLGMAGLVLAWSVQLAFHALVMAFLLVRSMRDEGGLSGYGIWDTTLKVAGAAAAMAAVSYGVWWALSQVVAPDSLVTEAVLLGVPALAGGGLYALLIWMMRLPEVELIIGKIRGRLKR